MFKLKYKTMMKNLIDKISNYIINVNKYFIRFFIIILYIYHKKYFDYKNKMRNFEKSK